jgi:2-polyprenyl-6-methoxyphenol hydroxylase-like FAD-dependent oxidoreductase
VRTAHTDTAGARRGTWTYWRPSARTTTAVTDWVAGFTQDADGVDVVFAGGDRRRFDLFVGADGLHSALRAMIGPQERFVH